MEGGLALAFARGGAVAAMLSGFGVLVFRVAVVPRAEASPMVRARVRRFGQWNLVAALVLLLWWLVLQSAALAETGVGGGLAAAAGVLGGTVFGRTLAMQAVAVAVALGVGRRWPWAGVWASGAAVVLQAGHGHGYAMADGVGWLTGSTAVHLVAAGAWLGGLWPLLMTVREGTVRSGAMAARWFSPLGRWCVAGMVGSAGVQGWVLIGGVPGLVGTAYGRVALVKLGLLGVLVGFAWVNRYRLAPGLLRAGAEVARGRMVGAVAVQTGVGLVTVLAAGVLASLPPGMHEQPVWPFAVRVSLVAMGEPELAWEVWEGGTLVGLAAVVLAAGAWWRRWAGFGVGVVAAAGLCWTAWPHLSPLLVEAYPTSYAVSPTGFAAASIVLGEALYAAHCSSCHGVDGRGDGVAAAELAVPPADLTAGHLWEHSDGELFWWLWHGMEGADGGLVMPGFADRLAVGDVWALIDAIRARNAGESVRGGGRWGVPVALPGFAVVCDGGVQREGGALRGRVLLVRLGAGAVSVGAAGGDGDVGCVTRDVAAWRAIGLVTGAGDGVDGSRLLVDGAGWLRAWTPGADRSWDDPAVLARAVAAIEAAPLAGLGGGHRH